MLVLSDKELKNFFVGFLFSLVTFGLNLEGFFVVYLLRQHAALNRCEVFDCNFGAFETDIVEKKLESLQLVQVDLVFQFLSFCDWERILVLHLVCCCL